MGGDYLVATKFEGNHVATWHSQLATELATRPRHVHGRGIRNRQQSLSQQWVLCCYKVGHWQDLLGRDRVVGVATGLCVR